MYHEVFRQLQKLPHLGVLVVERRGQELPCLPPHHQNRILPANSKSRGFPALVIVPKAALPNEPFGSFSGGVLLTLKASARNSRLTRSDRRNVLPIIRSASWSPGPRTGFRELLPMLNCPAALKADLSNHWEALRVANSFGLPMRFGR